eukprot:m.20047 g.20047  ORF g.20047 m.20047 type:complete len:1062 (+) comp8108_c0_seq3:151-3336(+)
MGQSESQFLSNVAVWDAGYLPSSRVSRYVARGEVGSYAVLHEGKNIVLMAKSPRNAVVRLPITLLADRRKYRFDGLNFDTVEDLIIHGKTKGLSLGSAKFTLTTCVSPDVKADVGYNLDLVPCPIWYTGDQPRAEVKEIVAHEPIGGFRVGHSSEQHRYALVVSEGEGTVISFVVHEEANGNYRFGAKQFANLRDLCRTMLNYGLKGSEGQTIALAYESSKRKEETRESMPDWHGGVVERGAGSTFVGHYPQGSYMFHTKPTDSNTTYLTVNNGTVAQYKVTEANGSFLFGDKPFESLDAFHTTALRTGLKSGGGILKLGKPLGKIYRDQLSAMNAGPEAFVAVEVSTELSPSHSSPIPASSLVASDNAANTADSTVDALRKLSMESLDDASAPVKPERRSSFAKKLFSKFTRKKAPSNANASTPSGASGTGDSGVDAYNALVEGSAPIPVQRPSQELASGLQSAEAPSSSSPSGMYARLSDGHSSSPHPSTQYAVPGSLPRSESGPELPPRPRSISQSSVTQTAAAPPPLPPPRVAAPPRPAAEVVQALGLNLPITPMDVDGYKALSRRQVYADELKPHCIGPRLNRFKDILPNPITRVRLPELKIDPTLEYINANYVRGYGGRQARAYIAAQGPLDTGTYNFWRMILYCNVKAVLMATGVRENGKEKCAPYFPHEMTTTVMKFGPPEIEIVVTLINATQGQGFLRSHLRVAHKGRTLDVMHYWCNIWPDHGVPKNEDGTMNTQDVIALLREIHHYRSVTDACEAPMLVHCSAGIGRTGVLIVIDHVLQALQIGDSIDVNQVIDELRQDRMALVQHVNQYKFCYQAAVDIAKDVSEKRQRELQQEQLAAAYEQHRADGQDLYGTRFDNTSYGSHEPIYAVTSKDRRASFDSNPDWQVHKADGDQVVFKLQAETLHEEQGDEVATFMPSEEQSVTPIEATEEPKRNPKDIHAQPWFRSNFTRAQVEQALGDAEPGTFLVRYSSKPGHFALSIKDEKRITNLLIVPVEVDGETHYKLGKSGHSAFATVTEMVEFLLSGRETGVSKSLPTSVPLGDLASSHDA